MESSWNDHQRDPMAINSTGIPSATMLLVKPGNFKVLSKDAF